MPGKNTAFNGMHPSRAGLVPDYQCSPQLLAALEVALGRPLEADEVARISDVIALTLEFRSDHFRASVARQDVIRTLGAIAAANDDTAARMAEDCDGTCDNLLHIVRWTVSGVTSVQQAASIALDRFKREDARPGRHKHRYQGQLVADALSLWHQLGGTNSAIFGKAKLSPLLLWVIAMLSAVENRPFDWLKADRLLKRTRNDFDILPTPR